MKVEIVTATYDHVFAMLPHVRRADREELWAASCISPGAALITGIGISDMALVGLVDDKPVCIFGVAPAGILSDTGRPWMIGTDRVEMYQMTFLRRCRKHIAGMLEKYPHLENFVDARNTLAVKWLRWMGFKIHEAEPSGPFGVMFHRFEMRRD